MVIVTDHTEVTDLEITDLHIRVHKYDNQCHRTDEDREQLLDTSTYSDLNMV